MYTNMLATPFFNWGVIRNFFFTGGWEAAQHPLGPKNPLKFIDFTGPGEAEPQ